ncbi:MAG: ATP-binding protein [Cyanobacteria bacterium QS_8_64_29]|nr:MAG: ATP-binding protein [Cyanobacteria bacterium QS_8_64_29]
MPVLPGKRSSAIASWLRPNRAEWTTVSFASTLYLHPILDLLLAHVPDPWEPELRLGLQEALVNAAKHGNQLDPCKTIVVRFGAARERCIWLVSDASSGLAPHYDCPDRPESLLPPEAAENGRGACILYQIFDSVDWEAPGTLRLYKRFDGGKRPHRLRRYWR